MPTAENEPAIERLCTALAATTGPNTEGRRDTSDEISKAHVFVTNKPRQAHLVWSVFGVFNLLVPFAVFSHVNSSLGLSAGSRMRPRRPVGGEQPWLDAESVMVR